MDSESHPARAASDIDAAALHQSLLTLDTHIDIPWPRTPDPFTRTQRKVDFPKMRDGHLVAGCFAAYVPQGPRTPEGLAAARDRALGMLETINGMGATAEGIETRVAATADAIEAAHGDGALVVIPAVENGHAIGEDVSLLARFRELGACYLTMSHNGHNLLCDSSNPRADLGDGPALHGGVSDLGREAVRELNRLGMLIDVSHVSKAAMMQFARLSTTPVVATHSCVRALCDHARNMDDEQIALLAETGGLIQITAVPSFVRPQGRADGVTVADYCDHVDHVARRWGVELVGISSDFDGGGGFSGWNDASESANLTAELVRRGYTAEEIALLWGGNFLRLLRRAEEAAKAGTATP